MAPSRNTAGREYIGIKTKQLLYLLYNVSFLTNRLEKEAPILAETALSELKHLLRILIRIPANMETGRTLFSAGHKAELEEPGLSPGMGASMEP